MSTAKTNAAPGPSAPLVYRTLSLEISGPDQETVAQCMAEVDSAVRKIVDKQLNWAGVRRTNQLYCTTLKHGPDLNNSMTRKGAA